MSIQREKSILESSTCSQLFRCSHMSCFNADKSIAKRLLSTCCELDDTRCENKLSKFPIQTRPIDADVVPSPRRMLSCPFMCRKEAGKRQLFSIPLDNVAMCVCWELQCGLMPPKQSSPHRWRTMAEQLLQEALKGARKAAQDVPVGVKLSERREVCPEGPEAFCYTRGKCSQPKPVLHPT